MEGSQQRPALKSASGIIAHLGVERKGRLPALWRNNLADSKLCLARLIGHTLDVGHGMRKLVDSGIKDWTMLEAE